MVFFEPYCVVLSRLIIGEYAFNPVGRKEIEDFCTKLFRLEFEEYWEQNAESIEEMQQHEDRNLLPNAKFLILSEAETNFLQEVTKHCWKNMLELIRITIKQSNGWMDNPEIHAFGKYEAQLVEKTNAYIEELAMTLEREAGRLGGKNHGVRKDKDSAAAFFQLGARRFLESREDLYSHVKPTEPLIGLLHEQDDELDVGFCIQNYFKDKSSNTNTSLQQKLKQQAKPGSSVPPSLFDKPGSYYRSSSPKPGVSSSVPGRQSSAAGATALGAWSPPSGPAPPTPPSQMDMVLPALPTLSPPGSPVSPVRSGRISTLSKQGTSSQQQDPQQQHMVIISSATTSPNPQAQTTSKTTAGVVQGPPPQQINKLLNTQRQSAAQFPTFFSIRVPHATRPKLLPSGTLLPVFQQLCQTKVACPVIDVEVIAQRSKSPPRGDEETSRGVVHTTNNTAAPGSTTRGAHTTQGEIVPPPGVDLKKAANALSCDWTRPSSLLHSDHADNLGNMVAQLDNLTTSEQRKSAMDKKVTFSTAVGNNETTTQVAAAGFTAGSHVVSSGHHHHHHHHHKDKMTQLLPGGAATVVPPNVLIQHPPSCVTMIHPNVIPGTNQIHPNDPAYRLYSTIAEADELTNNNFFQGAGGPHHRQPRAEGSEASRRTEQIPEPGSRDMESGQSQSQASIIDYDHQMIDPIAHQLHAEGSAHFDFMQSGRSEYSGSTGPISRLNRERALSRGNRAVVNASVVKTLTPYGNNNLPSDSTSKSSTSRGSSPRAAAPNAAMYKTKNLHTPPSMQLMPSSISIPGGKLSKQKPIVADQVKEKQVVDNDGTTKTIFVKKKEKQKKEQRSGSRSETSVSSRGSSRSPSGTAKESKKLRTSNGKNDGSGNKGNNITTDQTKSDVKQMLVKAAEDPEQATNLDDLIENKTDRDLVDAVDHALHQHLQDLTEQFEFEYQDLEDFLLEDLKKKRLLATGNDARILTKFKNFDAKNFRERLTERQKEVALFSKTVKEMVKLTPNAQLLAESDVQLIVEAASHLEKDLASDATIIESELSVVRTILTRVKKIYAKELVVKDNKEVELQVTVLEDEDEAKKNPYGVSGDLAGGERESTASDRHGRENVEVVFIQEEISEDPDKDRTSSKMNRGNRDSAAEAAGNADEEEFWDDGTGGDVAADDDKEAQSSKKSVSDLIAKKGKKAQKKKKKVRETEVYDMIDAEHGLGYTSGRWVGKYGKKPKKEETESSEEEEVEETEIQKKRRDVLAFDYLLRRVQLLDDSIKTIVLRMTQTHLKEIETEMARITNAKLTDGTTKEKDLQFPEELQELTSDHLRTLEKTFNTLERKLEIVHAMAEKARGKREAEKIEALIYQLTTELNQKEKELDEKFAAVLERVKAF
ncbi:unnamed protein product [Amoebophrya sp. A120]|nr:unnamed protein product [Amoebophrya sp. A120]|eukprot:GSA120T00013432001.1